MDFADDFGVVETVPAPALCPLSSTRVCTAFVRQGELVPGVGVGRQDQPGSGTASGDRVLGKEQSGKVKVEHPGTSWDCPGVGNSKGCLRTLERHEAWRISKGGEPLGTSRKRYCLEVTPSEQFVTQRSWEGGAVSKESFFLHLPSSLHRDFSFTLAIKKKSILQSGEGTERYISSSPCPQGAFSATQEVFDMES